ncbi:MULTISPECIES: hypothetical protein [unclassified Microcoleus]|nr:MULTISPECIES: hypothetical protein [unclassified Microcoleus]
MNSLLLISRNRGSGFQPILSGNKSSLSQKRIYKQTCFLILSL